MRQTLTQRGPGYKYGCAQRTVRHFPPKIKNATEPEPRLLHLFIISTFLTMLVMGGLYLQHVAVAALCCSVLATGTLGSPVVGPEPIRCAQCSPEKLSQCPAVAPGCAEVLREPGCGCCLACALKAEELCGIYTAPCGSGLRCTPRPGDPRPLHSLTRGQAVCTASTEPEPTPEPQTQGKAFFFHITTSSSFIQHCHIPLHIHSFPAPDQGEPEAEMANTAIVSDPGSSLYLPGHSKPYDPRAAADAQDSMKAKLIAIRKIMVEQVRGSRCTMALCEICEILCVWIKVFGEVWGRGVVHHKGELLGCLRR